MDGREGLWRRFKRRIGLSVPGVAALAIVALLQIFGFSAIDRAGILLFDNYQRLAPRAFNPDMPARIIDIDDETLKRLGQWPWPRSDVAELTRRLTDAGASAVAFDVVFSEPDRTAPDKLAARAARDGAGAQALAALKDLPDPDHIFAQTIAKSPVVLGYFLGHDRPTPPVQPKAGMAILGDPPTRAIENYTSSILPLPQLRDPASGLGFISLPPDVDGIIRKMPLLAVKDDQLLPSLSLEALRVAMNTGSVKVKSTTASREMGNTGAPKVTSLEIGDFEVPTTERGELWMYYTAHHPERVTPAWKVMTGALSPAQMEQLFKGRIVLIGSSAQGLYDLRSTPIVGRELGVAVHAQAIEQMVFKSFLVRPDWAKGLERAVLVGFGLLLALMLPWIGATRGAVLGAVLVGGAVVGSWLAFRQQQLLLDPVYPVLGFALVWVIQTATTFYREERQRAYIHQAFDRYLSPDMVRRIVDDPSRLQLGGEEREMTVLFCDIRQFSRISERLGPQEIIRFLIGFLTPMCDILLAGKATIDKFIGDAILAFWNAPLDDPDQYANAARGALAMVARLKQLNVEMANQNATPWPGEVQVGIGLNSGPCCVGNMGSAQRLSYSLIGDTVNVASRIEGLTKYYGVGIALGASLHEHLHDFACVPIDHVRLVGRDTPELLYALLGDEVLAGSDEFQAFATAHDAIGGAYRARAWDEAETLLDQQQAYAATMGLAKLYALMRERIAEYRKDPPPADWDGVYGATEK